MKKLLLGCLASALLICCNNSSETGANTDSTTIVNLPGHLPVPDSIMVLDSTTQNNGFPASFNPQEALRIIGYDIKDLEAAIRAFKHHFIQRDINATLTESDKRVLYHLYQKYL